MNKFRNKKGITVISLVVTIVIMLILAGISIGTLAGKDGILTKATQVKEEQIIAMEIEQIEIAYLSCKRNVNKPMWTHGITDAELQEELRKNKNDVETTSNETSEGYFIYVTFNTTTHKYVIDENGNIKRILDEQFDTSEIDKKMVKQAINFQDSLATISNPDRGWYRPVLIELGSDIDIQAECSNAIKEKIQILQLRINIGQLSGNANTDGVDKDFTLEQISSLNTILDTIRKNQLNVIIRFAYSYDGSTGQEPKSFETIKKHIKQLSSFFNKNKDIISTVETGFLGPWGEMHTAGIYQEDNYYKILIETLLENTPRDIKVNVRKPYFFKLVVGDLNDSQHRLGIYNDGYLGSSTDLGTFDNGISRNDFVNWMQTQGRYTLYGGEATKFSTTDDGYSSNDEQYSESSFALEEMPKTHTAYLNSQFNTLILEDKWKNQIYTNSSSEYNGTTAYKYITDHLGYRMVVRDSKISSSVKKGDICGVNLELENVGFGNIVKTQKVSVMLRKDQEYYETTLNINMNNVNSGEKNNVNFYFYIPSDIEYGDWLVYLKVSNKLCTDYSVQFANADMWDKDLSANCIGKVTIENSVANEGIKIKQAFSITATDGHKGQVVEKIPTIPVVLAFCQEGVGVLSSKQFNFTLGTTIDFKDLSNLASLGVTIPSGYTFKGAQCEAITGDLIYHDSLVIPTETSADSYWVNVFVKDNKTTVTLSYCIEGTGQINYQQLNLEPGTTINFTNSSNLSSLGIIIPSGYMFKGAQCEAITGDLAYHNSITIPNSSSADSYWVNVFVKDYGIPVTIAYCQEGVGVLSSEQFNFALGTIIDFKNESQLLSLGITFPSGYTFKGAQCEAITGDLEYHESITIPNSTSASSYWINVYVKDNKIPMTFAYCVEGVGQIDYQQLNLEPGTTINFSDSSNLSSLGITIPSGYTFNGAQCEAITGDLAYHNSLAIPTETSADSYWVSVYVQK